MLAGEPVSVTVATENGIRLAIDFDHGQKTGAFLDQRDNRVIVRDWRAAPACSTPAVMLAASRLRRWRAAPRRSPRFELRSRARDGAAQSRTQRPCARPRQLHWGDAALFMATAPDRFDLIVLDPPPLRPQPQGRASPPRASIPTSTRTRCARWRPAAMLMTFSCRCIFAARISSAPCGSPRAKAGRKLQMLARLGPGSRPSGSARPPRRRISDRSVARRPRLRPKLFAARRRKPFVATPCAMIQA